MWPFGHAAVGYLLYTGYTRLTTRDLPTLAPLVALAVGTQLPDLIDKPAAYWFGLFAQGRALGHTLLFLVPLCVLVVALATSRTQRPVGVAFTVGALSHPLADAIPILRGGAYGELSYLLWPVLTTPDYPTQSFGPHVAHWSTQAQSFTPTVVLTQWWSNFFIFQSWLTLVAGLVWLHDGAPGLHDVLHLFRDGLSNGDDAE